MSMYSNTRLFSFLARIGPLGFPQMRCFTRVGFLASGDPALFFGCGCLGSFRGKITGHFWTRFW